MRKFKKFVRNNIKFFVGIIFGIILSIGTSFAATIIYDSDEVRYDNTTSGMTSTDVQGALDELYARRPQGNAIADQVLSGNTFSNATTSGIAGTMPDNSTRTSNGNVPGINSNYPNVPTREGTALQMGTDTDGVSRISISPPTGYYPGPGTSYVNRPASDFGNAAATSVLTGSTFTSTAGIKVSGSMANRGAWSKSVSTTTAQTGAAGYYSSVSCAKAANSGTFTTSTNSTAVDMGANQNYRYVNTSGVYNAGVSAGKSAAAASRVRVWSGNSNAATISVNLSAYNWVYVITDNGGTYGSAIFLQVGGAKKYVCVTQSGAGQFCKYIQATTSGITKSDAPEWDYVGIREIWGIKNLS